MKLPDEFNEEQMMKLKAEEEEQMWEKYYQSQIDEIWNENLQDDDQEQLWRDEVTRKRKEIDEIPINLIIDTNWWIYLSKEVNISTLRKLAEKLNKGEYRILVPKPIISEWDRNLKKTKNSAKAAILEQSKNASKISRFLTQPDKSQFEAILKKYKAKETSRIDSIDSSINLIDKIIKSKSEIIPISKSTMEKVIEHGLLKKAPFKSKNSTGDATIFFSAMEYLKANTDSKISNSIFVSNNTDDFSKSKNEKGEIHPDLKEFLDASNTKFEQNLAKAINLSKDMQKVIDDYLNEKAESLLEDEYIERQIDDYIQRQIEIRRGK